MADVTLPALGESVTEGTVTRWLKKVGDTIAVDEPLVEVSTDKVDTEIPSPVAGVIQQILVQEDETVAVGAVLAVIGDVAAPAVAAPATPAPVAAPVEIPAPIPAPVEAPAVVAPPQLPPAPALQPPWRKAHRPPQKPARPGPRATQSLRPVCAPNQAAADIPAGLAPGCAPSHRQ